MLMLVLVCGIEHRHRERNTLILTETTFSINLSNLITAHNTYIDYNDSSQGCPRIYM